MSSMWWDGNRIMQSVGSRDSSAELGYVGHDKHAKKYVLWLKDYGGDFIGNAGHYVRGDTWTSMEEAREEAPRCASAFLLHLKWMHSLGPVPFCLTEAMILGRTSGVRLSTTCGTVYLYRSYRNQGGPRRRAVGVASPAEARIRELGQ